MIFILYGADTYRSRARLRAMIQEFEDWGGADLGVGRIDGEECGVGILKELCEGQSLFSKKKLIIAENFLHNSEEFELVFPDVSSMVGRQDAVVILWEREIAKDKQKKYAALFRSAQTEEFGNLDNAAKQKFIEEEGMKRGITLNQKDCILLSQCSDSWAIIHLLDRLALEMGGGVRTDAAPQTIFALGDTFYASVPAALKTLLYLLRQGEDEFGIFSYISNYTRTLLIAKAYAEQREPIPASFGVHPFVAKKAMLASQNLSQKKIEAMHAGFFEEDFCIKTGLSRPRDSLIHILFRRTLEQ